MEPAVKRCATVRHYEDHNKRRVRTDSERQSDRSESTDIPAASTPFNRRGFLQRSLGGVGATIIGFSGIASADATTASADRDCTTLPPKSEGGDEIGDIILEEVTDDVGLLEPLKGMMGHATAWGDVTGNGWLDLFVGTFTGRPRENYLVRGSEGIAPDRLLLGGPDGFTVAEDFPEMYGRTSGAAFVDLDNDGDLDLVLSRNDSKSSAPNDKFNEVDNQTIVLENDNGVFSRVTTLDNGGVVDHELYGRTVVPFDYDDDGLIDLFIIDDHYGDDRSSLLFRNEGGFEFSDATEDAGLPRGITGLGAAAADFTGNGWPDLLVSGSVRTDDDPGGFMEAQSARLFLNSGGSFREVNASSFTLPSHHSVDESGGIAVADLNRNGRLDVVLGEHKHVALNEGIPAARVFLHRGLDAEGVPKFEDVTDAAGIPDVTTRVPHVELVDLNNNGWPDLHTSLSRGDGTKPAVFQHTGVDENGVPQFATPPGLGEERTEPPTQSQWETVVGIDRYWAVGASEDYDRDGRMDPFLVEWFQELPSRMFHNESDAGNYLFVDVTPQAEAIGARVELFCPGRLGEEDSRIATQSVTANTGYASGVSTELHFGLGQAPAVDIKITLPHDGRTVERRGVRANQHLTIDTEETP